MAVSSRKNDFLITLACCSSAGAMFRENPTQTLHATERLQGLRPQAQAREKAEAAERSSWGSKDNPLFVSNFHIDCVCHNIVGVARVADLTYSLPSLIHSL